jgi:hypothetical protein
MNQTQNKKAIFYIIGGVVVFLLILVNLGLFSRLVNVKNRGKVVFYTEYPEYTYLLNDKRVELKDLGLGEYIGVSYLEIGFHELIVRNKDNTVVFGSKFKIEKTKTTEINVNPIHIEPREFDDAGPNPDEYTPE